MKRVVIMLVLLAAVGGAVWYGVFRTHGDSPDRLTLYGNVDIREARLGFRVAGRIADMKVDEGDPVAPGDLLATLDATPYHEDLALAEALVAAQDAQAAKLRAGIRPQDISTARAKVAQGAATLANAQVELERAQSLLLTNLAASRQQFDTARANRDTAQARLAQARAELDLALTGYRAEDIASVTALAQAARAWADRARTRLGDTELRAPTAGTILTRVQEPGTVVAAGMPVYTLSVTKPVRVRAYVDEPDLGRIKPGMTAEIHTDSRDKPYRGHIGFIASTAEFTPKTVQTPELRTDLVYRLRVVVDDDPDGLRQGMPVTVVLPVAPAPPRD